MRGRLGRVRGEARRSPRPQVGDAKIARVRTKYIAARGRDFAGMDSIGGKRWTAPPNVCWVRFIGTDLSMAEGFRTPEVGQLGQQGLKHLASDGWQLHIRPSEQHRAVNGHEVVFVAGVFIGSVGFFLGACRSVVWLPVNGVPETYLPEPDVRQLSSQCLNEGDAISVRDLPGMSAEPSGNQRTKESPRAGRPFRFP